MKPLNSKPSKKARAFQLDRIPALPACSIPALLVCVQALAMAEHVRHRSQATSSTAGGTGAFWDLSSRQPPHHFIGGLLLEHFRGRRRAQRWGLRGEHSLVSLGILGTYKYYNFFALPTSARSLRLHGHRPRDGSHSTSLLPVGISFYTFQTLAYTIDVYREKIEPTRRSRFLCLRGASSPARRRTLRACR